MNTPKQQKQKPKLWSEMHDDERAAILQHLADGGFGSELRVRKIFADEGFESSAYYFYDKDGPDGGRTREVDLFAQRKGGVRDMREFYHQIIGEVKSGYIWILGDVVGEDVSYPQGTLDGEPPKWFTEATRGLRPRQTHPLDTDGDAFALEQASEGSSLAATHVATSIHQHRTDSSMDAWFEAATKVSKVAAGLEKPHYIKGTEKVPFPFFLLTVPLIVLDGNLLAAVYGPEGLRLEPRDHAQVVYTVAGASSPVEETFVHIVTMEGLTPFLRKIMAVEKDASQRAVRFHDKVMAAAEKARL